MPRPTSKLGFYRLMERLPLPRGYVGKFLVVAFVGVHVPLISVVFFMVVTQADWSAAVSLLLLMLLATLVGTGATLWLQLRLLEPVLQTASALEAYRAHREQPDLPTEFGDEAGTLMSRAQACVMELDELVDFRTSLLRVMAHDLRGMVTSASLSSELVEDELEQEAPDLDHLRDLNAIVRESGLRQQSLIADIMGMAQSEEGRLELHRSPTDLRALLERVATLLQFRAREKGITVRCRVVPGASAALDRDKMQQVLQNLADNALKFTGHGGSVTLDATVDAEAVVFGVEDDGVGMPPEVRESLFQPFSAGQRSGTAREAGTGLGLWICQVLVEAHGGTFTVESEEGVGTRIEARIPLPAAEASGGPSGGEAPEADLLAGVLG